MKQSKSHTKSLLIAAIVLVAGYLVWTSIFGVKQLDPELQREAEANSPECDFEKEELDMERIYTEKEAEENAQKARACFEAVVRYVKAKRAQEN